MTNFGMNSARSYIGKRVNLHMKDGSVIVNVTVLRIIPGDSTKPRTVECRGRHGKIPIAMNEIEWAVPVPC